MIIVIMPIPVRVGNIHKNKLHRTKPEEVHAMAIDESTGDLYNVEMQPREICYHPSDKALHRPMPCDEREKKEEASN